MSTLWETQLSPPEVEAYKKLFQAAAKSQPNVVTGMEAVQFFAKSGLSNNVLSEIWETADEKNLGYLTQDTFAIALKLIACAQNNIKATEPLFSTVTPLPQIQGVQVITGSVMTPKEKKKYQAIYKSQQPTANGIPAEAAKTLFSKSRLPNHQLTQIWELVDIRKNGYLDETEFIIAMYYIAKLMDKSITTLPTILPPDVYAAASNTSLMSPLLQSRAKKIDTIGTMAFSSTNPLTSWDVTAHEKAQYDTYFKKLDKQHKGLISGPEAVQFFNNSKLPEQDLAKIWDLADIRKSGTLNPNEFAVAMHLIHARLMGSQLPRVLPFTLLPPPILPVQSPMSTGGSPTTRRFSTLSTGEMSSSTQRGFSFPPADQDLIGDFGNEQVIQETNAVNLLQNQLTTTKKSTLDIESKKTQLQQSLKALEEKKQDLQTQVDALKSQHRSDSTQLQQLKECIASEQPEWDKEKSTLQSAEQELKSTTEQVESEKSDLKKNQVENEKLRRSVHNIQMETMKLTKALDDLHAEHERRQQAIAKKKAEEKARLAEEAKCAEEARIAEEEAKRAEEARIAEEEAKRAEEARIAEEEAKRVEEARIAEEEAKRVEEARIAEEEAKRVEEARIAEEEAKRVEEARIAEEEAKRVEEARIAEEEAKRVEEARIAEEEAKRAEEARIAEEEAKRAEEAIIAEEEAKRVEEVKLAEEARIAEETRVAGEAKLAEEARLTEEVRLAEEAKHAEEEARLVEETKRAEELKRAEETRIKQETEKAERASLAAAKIELEKKQEEERLSFEQKEEEDRISAEFERRKQEEQAALELKQKHEQEGREAAELKQREQDEKNAAELKQREQDEKDAAELKQRQQEEKDAVELKERQKQEVAAAAELKRKQEEEEQRMAAELEQQKREKAAAELKRKQEEEERVGLELKQKQEKAAAELKREQELELKRVQEQEAALKLNQQREEEARINAAFEQRKQEEKQLKLQEESLAEKLINTENDKENTLIIDKSNASKSSRDDEETESVDDFFDAVEAPRSVGRKERQINNDDNEFVMIDHPQQTRVANNNNDQDPFLTETEQNSKPDVAENIKQEPVLKPSSTFDAVFGVVDNQEEEPVMVSSFTDESEVSASTNSSTHRVAPAPPPSRKSNKQRNTDTPIFGSIQETNVSDFNNTSSQVTPAQKTAPSEHASSHQLLNRVKNDKEAIDSKGEKQGVDRGVKEEPKTITTLTKKGEEKKKKKKNIVSWAKSFGGFDFNGHEDDKKKKKKDKKKAKEETPTTAPPSLSKAKKEDTSNNNNNNNNTLVNNRNETVSEPPQPTNHHISFPAYDPATIQGSHIAELVNMGFDPAAALEALDRYDQDLEKATNYLLDQSYQ